MSQEKIYRYKFSKSVIYYGLLQLLFVSICGYFFYRLYDGGYISAWFISFVAALFLLLILSLPRKIVLSPSTIRIHCILEIAEIKLSDIVRVRKVNPRTLKWIMPLIGSYGFFGYYGKFVDLRRAERIKMYATQWSNLVEIVDIYEDRYVVSCSDSKSFISAIRQQINKSE